MVTTKIYTETSSPLDIFFHYHWSLDNVEVLQRALAVSRVGRPMEVFC